MKSILALILIAFAIQLTVSGQSKMVVNGRIQISEESATPLNGEIRYHNGDFQGYANDDWYSLTTKPSSVFIDCNDTLTFNSIKIHIQGISSDNSNNLIEECYCDDGLDNDGDGFIDCGDADCGGDEQNPIECNCVDNVDNDGDGLIDCLDLDDCICA